MRSFLVVCDNSIIRNFLKLGTYSLTHWKLTGLLIGIAVFLAFETISLGLSSEARHAAAVSALMISWWFSEALPIHWTALIPLLAFPLLGVTSFRRTLEAYLDWNIFLFLGGMGIAAAMERWNLHRRVALNILNALGGGSSRLILGFLCSTGFISLWISNTATAVMMVPIGIAVIKQLEEERKEKIPHLALAIMLSIAYAANVGGIGTKIGTAPNVIFCQSAEQAGRAIGFLEFLVIGLPFVFLFLPIVWWRLSREASKDRATKSLGREAISAELRALGPMSAPEKWILAVFFLTATLWIFGKPISQLLGLSSSSPFDASVAMVAAFLLWLIPIGRGRRALDLVAVRRIPYSVLLLLGGSFAMAEGLGTSGLVQILGHQTAILASWPGLAAFLVVSLATVALSAAASNTGTTVLMMGILRGAFPSDLSIPIMATATIAASCDFMLPAGTPPNAVVFGSGYVSIRSMIRVGFFLDIAAALLAGFWGWYGIRLLL